MFSLETSLASYTCTAIEQAVWIDLVLDFQEARIVVAEKLILPLIANGELLVVVCRSAEHGVEPPSGLVDEIHHLSADALPLAKDPR